MRFSIAIILTGLLFSVVAPAAEPTWQVYAGWPFDTAEAAKRQAETAKVLNSADPLKISLGDKGPTLNFRLIPAGAFEMGSPPTESGHENDEKLHPETISEPFYMLETQLTLEAYRTLLQTDPAGTAADAEVLLPAAIPYRDAIDKLLPAVAKVVPKGWKVILPDRARLEYAARAGVATMNPGGDKETDAEPFAWYKANSENKPHPVAKKKPNAWGLYDVIGNRWHFYWAGPGNDGDNSTQNHLVYGGTFYTPASGNGGRLANIMVSNKPEGVRLALIREECALPKGHPETLVKAEK